MFPRSLRISVTTVRNEILKKALSFPGFFFVCVIFEQYIFYAGTYESIIAERGAR